MEQLKPILIALNTHRFWVACGVTALLCMVMWFLATSKLGKESSANATEITSGESRVKNLSPSPVVAAEDDPMVPSRFPNTQVEAGMTELINSGRVAVAGAWETQYSKQKDLFVWPEDLSEKARETFRVLRPIEKKLPFPTPQSVEIANSEQRLAYRDYIAKRLPELAEYIGTTWVNAPPTGPMDPMGPVDPSGGDPFGAAAGTEVDEPIVKWDEKNQDLWHEKTTKFTGRNGNTDEANKPLTIQVMYAQEDLWILEAIFKVIKATNGDADANDLADIKEIDHIFVGIDATGTTGEVAKLGSASNSLLSSGPSFGGGGGGQYDPMAGSSTGAGGGGTTSDGRDASSVSAVGQDPADNRYVDKNFKSLSASMVRGAFTNRTPENAYLAVAKRVPVRIALKMREGALFPFLANCANSKPTLEIRQVRVNRHKPGEKGRGAAETTTGGPGSGYGDGSDEPTGAGAGANLSLPNGSFPGSGSDGGYPGGGSFPGASGNNFGTGPDEEVIDVEVYGIVYIFNPVDEERVKPEGQAPDGGLPSNTVTATGQPARNEAQGG